MRARGPVAITEGAVPHCPRTAPVVGGTGLAPTPQTTNHSKHHRQRGNVCPARARCATFVISILALAPSLSSPWEVPQVDRTGPQTFPAKHVWAEWLHHPCLLGGRMFGEGGAKTGTGGEW